MKTKLFSKMFIVIEVMIECFTLNLSPGDHYSSIVMLVSSVKSITGIFSTDINMALFTQLF